MIRVGFASTDGIMVNEHFGHAKYWEIYDIGETEAVEVGSRIVHSGCNCHDTSLLDETLEELSDCKALFVAKIGEGAASYLMRKGVRVFEAAGNIELINKKLIAEKIL